jgi:hypothetical protein
MEPSDAAIFPFSGLFDAFSNATAAFRASVNVMTLAMATCFRMSDFSPAMKLVCT